MGKGKKAQTPKFLQQMDCIGITVQETINRNDINTSIRSRDREKARLGYCQAGLLVSKLLRKHGFEKIRASLESLKSGHSKRPYDAEGDRQEIEDILSEAENTYLPKFKLDGNYRLNIYVCKDLPEFIKLTGAGSWNGGHFTNRTIYLQRLAALRNLGILQQTLP